MHVRADIYQAFEDAFKGVPIVDAVNATSGNQPPPNGKVNIQFGWIEEGPNKRLIGDPVVLQRKAMMGAKVTATVPDDMSDKEFEANVLAPVEVAIATSEAMAGLADDWFIHTTQWQPAQDGRTLTLEAVMAWEITYTTAAGQPGVAL